MPPFRSNNPTNSRNLLIYLGLGGSNAKTIPSLPAPKGYTCLPKNVMRLYEDSMDALQNAVQKGNSGEDDSRGYSLSNDAIDVHEYASSMNKQ